MLEASEKFRLQADAASREKIQAQRNKETMHDRDIAEEDAREVWEQTSRTVDILWLKKGVYEREAAFMRQRKGKDFSTLDYKGVLDTLSKKIDAVSHDIDTIVAGFIEHMDSENCEVATQCLADLLNITDVLPNRASLSEPRWGRDLRKEHVLLNKLPLTDVAFKMFSRILNQPIIETPDGDAIKLGEIKQEPILFYRSGVIETQPLTDDDEIKIQSTT